MARRKPAWSAPEVVARGANPIHLHLAENAEFGRSRDKQGRSRMKHINFARLALTALLMSPGAALATNTMVASVFTGEEGLMDPLPYPTAFCPDPDTDQFYYQDAGSFQVAADGSYRIADAFDYFAFVNGIGVDIVVFIYDGEFDSNAPLNNLITPDGLGIDTAGRVELLSGATYSLVVQQRCENKLGAWSIAFSGPGNVISDRVRDIPVFTEGLITDADPVALTDCALNEPAPYREIGPVRLTVGGKYYYTDLRSFWYNEIKESGDIDACLQVYSQPFDPQQPEANRIGRPLDDDGTILLDADTDYYFVVQPFDNAGLGEYFLVFAPPAPFRINKALAGGWFNPQTSGQGFFLDIYEKRNQMFAGWYTFDLSRPVDGTAQLGEPGHRWLTAFGSFAGAVGDLSVFLAEGGAFDSVSPPINSPQTNVGSITFQFDDCITGSAEYALTTPQVSGTIPLQPLADDHVELCESLTEQPGMPGPL